MAGRAPRWARTALLAVLATVAAAGLAGCSGSAADEVILVGAQPSAEPSIYPLPPPVVETTPAVAASDGAGVIPYARAEGGVPLPDQKLTPGAAYPDVTEVEICDLHYTQGVRQPRFNTKVEAFSIYGVSIHDREIYQVDQLVPVNLGGNSDVSNIWPQPYEDPGGAERKDALERQLRGLVCSDKLSLKAAQEAIATDWWAAYEKYMGIPIDPGSAGLEPWTRPTDDPDEVRNQGPCSKEGEVGFTESKGIRFTCKPTADGELRWQKRS